MFFVELDIISPTKPLPRNLMRQGFSMNRLVWIANGFMVSFAYMLFSKPAVLDTATLLSTQRLATRLSFLAWALRYLHGHHLFRMLSNV